ncbi:hydrogenase expression/formation protein HypE [Halarchaeum rubridurum]|uniref:Hydrogenase n=1 Tax=Halarchaeum rubridurum TaxID=489911 RepID=A0A830FYA7_9EURY|nr:AIR synthase family protein [Halarchaeum rubridurum]MBP1954862.1 hydrogenase expression/formation protein HypE [Halarchaeum rubridurum]GGM60339.1 hydrogenase [Halarchaeum rubridurum]
MSKFSADELLDEVYGRTGADDERVVVGPGPGEDAAGVQVGDETLVVSTDPISMAADRIGQLAVTIVTNTVAAAGGDPRYLTSTVLLPEHDTDLLGEVVGQIDETASDLDQSVVAGHSESVVGLDRPLVSMTALGRADSFVPTSGAEPGDDVVLTKAAGIEATGVLATDYREHLDGVDDDTVERARAFFDDVSIIPDAAAVRSHANAMHDPTEGGVLAGLVDLALAADVTIDVARDDVPVREETRALCEAAGVDPLRVLCSGGLLAAVPSDESDAVLAACADAGIDAAVVGTVADGDAGVSLDGERFEAPPTDEVYELLE